MMTATDISRLAGEYALDTEHTRIGFVARHSMATRVRGRFEEYEGRVRLDGDDPSRSQVEIAIRAGSIQTRNRQRDGQLRGHFLDDRNHPVIRFGSTEVERAGDTTYEVTGDLTIRGVTKPVTVMFELTGAENDRVGFTGGATINRRDWDVHWNAAGFLVKEKVTLDFDVSLIRRS